MHTMHTMIGILLAMAPALAVAMPDGSGAPRIAATSNTMVVREIAVDTLDPLTLDPLVVTVLRSALDLAEVPAAVSVSMTEGTARTGHGLGLDEPIRAIPGLQIENRYNYALGERVSIRGFGARTQFGVRGIRVIVDGLPATLPDGQTAIDHIDLSGLGRAEILRGVASALYGNAAGGVIQLESAPPPGSPLHQEIRTLVGSDRLLRLESKTGGTLGRLSYGVDLTRLTYDGYREHSGTTNHYLTGRLGYLGERDDLRFTLRYVDLDALNPGALTRTDAEEDPARAAPNNLDQRTGKRSDQLQLGLHWKRSLAQGDLEFAAYRLGRKVENPTPPQIIDIDRVVGGARLVYNGWLESDSESAPVRWSFGLETDRQRDDRQNHENLQGERGDRALDQIEWVTGIGLFGQLSVPLTDQIGALLGLRYDHFEFEAEDHFPHPDGADFSGRRTMSALSPSAGLILHPTEGLGLFANYGTSFQTPTTTELGNRPEGAGGFNPDLEPERTHSFEIGARGEIGWTMGDQRTQSVVYQLALYHARTRSALIGFEVPTVPGRTFYRNAGSAVHRGIEAELSAPLTGHLTLELAYALTDARFGSYEVDGEVLDGKRVPGIAPHQAEARLTYQPMPGELELWLRGHSRTYPDDANTEAAPGYLLAGLRAGLAPVEIAGLEIAPFAGIDNLFDRHYYTALAVNAFGGRYYEPGPRRSFFFGTRMRLGGSGRPGGS